jgi:cysteine desulfuration protein SufE
MTIDDVIEAFSLMDDWADKYRYLIELGRTLPPFPDEERTAANKVLGCQSQVWLVATPSVDETDGTIRFTFLADSDAHIVRGLVALVLLLTEGKSADELATLDPRPMFAELGLDQHLSQGRTNGLLSMVGRVKQLADTARSVRVVLA